MMKERSFVFLGIFVFLLILPFVSAQFSLSSPKQFIEEAITGVTDVFEPVFQALFGNYASSEFLFVKVLLLVLLFVVIYTVAQKVEFMRNSRGVAFVVALVISLLGVRFISDNQLTQGILLPYGTLAVALTVILPFLLFFYFIHVTNIGSFGRRVFWIIFLIVFLVLWVSRSSEIGSVANQIYGWTLAAMVLVLIFDKSIHYYFRAHELSMFYRGANQRTIAGLQAEYLNIVNVDTPQARRRRADIERQLRALGAALP